ncbi:hypothetical protein B0T11DRAFT_278429 [Plectosphaerella cucumerina]|jgi:hypothetical protein|uniref:Uncharacterized protein n=1 Tax=Plectosphaerella cucumerina TaxID=40658 RepID=A0A8K0TL18_9PEZI|nr:hypothetical protein B0T11DRAFT_278429 [Plectosphaerella cucumerina]
MAGPVVLSPSSPYELVEYIVAFQKHPTTLLICSTREEFFGALLHEIKSRLEPTNEPNNQAPLSLLSSPLYQQAVARHIRILFVPTVAHLRSFLAVFEPKDSKVPPPPGAGISAGRRPPLLLVYGFLDLHRDSSEWSAQGISNTAAALVEGARRVGFQATIVEPKDGEKFESFEALLADAAPVLSGSGGRREDGGWTGRRIEVRRILGRWFRFQTGQWDVE